MSLGKDNYKKYFTDTSTGPSVGPLEFAHYSEMLLDKQMTDAMLYRANKKAHVYSLLRHLMTILRMKGLIFNCEWPDFPT